MNAFSTIESAVADDASVDQQKERSKKRSARIIGNARAIFLEAHASGSSGEFFDEAWKKSAARVRLMQPAKSSMSAIERRDRTLYFFEEGLRVGHSGTPAEFAWKQSYSLVIAAELAERAALRDG